MSGLAGLGLAAKLAGVRGALAKVPWQAWATIAAALVLGFLIVRGNHWEHRAHKAEAQVSADCTAIRKSHPKLACDQTDDQIAFMSAEITDLSNALAKQNAAVDALAKTSEDQQRKAAQASLEARQRAKGAQKVSDSLAASARAPERLKQPCAPSKALEGAWK